MSVENNNTQNEEEILNFKIYETMLYNANDIIILLSNEGKILKVNKKAVESYGYAEDELLRMNIFDLREKKDFKLANSQFKKAKSDGIEFETMHYRKDGSNFYVEVRSVGLNVGECRFVVSIIRDISRRMEREHEIRQLAYIVENSSDAIIGKNLDGIITSWNKGAESLYGYTRYEAVGKHIFLIIPREKEYEFYKIISKIKNGDKIEEYETIRKKKNNDVIDVSVTISPIYDLEGNLLGTSNITRDITEKIRKEKELIRNYEEISALYEELTATEEELRDNYIELEKAKEEADKANEVKSKFLANISHEIRTPMNGIIGIVELLKLSESSSMQREYLDILSSSSELLMDILNTMLDISKIESQKFQLNMRPFNLKKTLDRITKELSIACKNKKLKAVYYIDPLINFNLIGDELRLNQILINIVNNAVKFTESGQIIFKVTEVSRFNNKIILQFSIKDTGIGIKEAFKSEVFKKFVQQDMSYDKRYYGAGLGLAISKELVKMMNGDIWFESVEGVGSTFYFTIEFLLDINKNMDNSYFDIIEDACDLDIRESKTILIVEDNEINMKIACGMLSDLGYEFISADNGLEALKILENKSVDLILMDTKMPRLNGHETAKIIRKNEFNKQKRIPIIAMTPYAVAEDKGICIEVGMDDYISKPFELKALNNIIKKFI